MTRLKKRKNDITYDLDRHNTFLNIRNKSESEVLRLLISKLPHMGHLSCQYIKKDGSKLPRMAPFSCQYIKRDGSICGKGCWRPEGCSRHFNARPKKICPICNEETYAKTGICSTHKRIYKNAWRKGKKVKMESDMIETPS